MVRDDRVTAEAAVLSLGTAAAALLTGLFTVVPFSAVAPRRLGVVLTLVALVLFVVLRRTGGLTPAWLRHGTVATGTAGITAAIAASNTEAGPGVTAYGFLWVVIHSATFHRRPALMWHLAGVGVGLGVGLALSGAPSPVHTWVFVMSTAGAVAVVLNMTVERMRTEAGEDPLTRAATRREFLRAAHRSLLHAERRGGAVSLVLVDLDDFKLVNDRGGHAAGDDLLESTAQAWRGVLRRGDVLGRIGGDEFAVLLPGADEATARAVVARMREHSPTPWSAGVAAWSGEPLDDLFRRADDELYAVKAGRR